MFKEVADIQTADMLNLFVPKAHCHNITVKLKENEIVDEKLTDVPPEKERTEIVR